jgi:GNAT superfamily N-acetyltransferase
VTHAAATSPASASPLVRAATQDDLPALVSSLSEAFFNDPIFRWCAPDDGRRAAMLPRFFELFADAMRPAGHTYVAGDGAALWSPPQLPIAPADELEEFGRMVMEACGEDGERVAQVGAVIDERAPDGDYYYLHFLGVRPASQGQGTGSALLKRVLYRADREGVPAYLEATSPENRRLYERHGFVVREEFSPEGCPPLFAMWREPAGK